MDAVLASEPTGEGYTITVWDRVVETKYGPTLQRTSRQGPTGGSTFPYLTTHTDREDANQEFDRREVEFIQQPAASAPPPTH